MQMNLPFEEGKPVELRKNSLLNKINSQDHAFHNWYRFVLSFPPHLVRDYIQKFRLSTQDTILDPFCGTGTTLVEAKLNGINSIGIEANPIAHLATCVKVDWNLDSEELVQHARIVAESALKKLKNQNTARHTLPPEACELLLKDW